MSGFLGFSALFRDSHGGREQRHAGEERCARPRFAQSLSSHLFALMRGHGSVTVAHSSLLAVRLRHLGRNNAKLEDGSDA